MACSSSLPSSLTSLFVPLPVVSVGLKFLVLGTILSSFLIPAAVVLFFFSTPRLRRRPIFIFSVTAIVFGLIQGIINFVNAIRPMLNQPQIPIASSTLAISLYVLVPLCVESVLILRVITVYPPRLLSRDQCFALYGPIVLMKVARVANATYFIYLLSEGPHAQDALYLAESVWHMPNAKVEWLLQLIDDTYVSGLFLFRIHAGTRTGLVGRPPLKEGGRGSDSFHERLKTLFWIAASNFVFPVVLNVVQLVLILRDADFERGTLVLMVNNYVTIIGVLLATIWASGSEVRERASARWTTGTGNRKMPASVPRFGEKHAHATFSRRGRPRSAPPRSAVVVHIQEPVDVLPASAV